MTMKAPAKIPWMNNTKEGEWISMEVDWTTCDDIINEKEWPAYVAVMADIDHKGDNGKQIKDGKHEVPFWAREAFWDLYEERKIEGGQTLDDIEFMRIVDGLTEKGKPNNVGKFRLVKVD